MATPTTLSCTRAAGSACSGKARSDRFTLTVSLGLWILGGLPIPLLGRLQADCRPLASRGDRVHRTSIMTAPRRNTRQGGSLIRSLMVVLALLGNLAALPASAKVDFI